MFVIGNGVDAGNPANALTVLKNGDVGIGTTSPDEKLDISGGNVEIDNGQYYKAIRNLNSSSVAVLGFPSGSDFLQLKGGTTNSSGGVKIINSGGTAIATFRGDGNVGIGTTTPNELLEVYGASADASIRLAYDATNYATFTAKSNGNLEIRSTNGGNYARYDGDNNWNFPSDERLKTGIEDAGPFLSKVMQLKVRRYNYKEGDTRDFKEIGLIAQEVEPYFPEIVGTSEDERFEDGVKTLGYTTFGVIALKAVQEQQDEIEELGAENDVLKAEVFAQKQKVSELEARLTRLEQLL